jgi:GGDEF domain-containing protein
MQNYSKKCTYKVFHVKHFATFSERQSDTVSRAPAGDELGRLAGDGTLARLGGDEFTILLDDIKDPIGAVRVASESVNDRTLRSA